MSREELGKKLRLWLPNTVEESFSFSDGEVDAVNAAGDNDEQEMVIYGIMARILEAAAEECRMVESGESY